jgi:hypothetical protein
MSTKKTATKKSPENPVQVLREAQCKSLGGSATLTYHIGQNEAGDILFKIAGNTGGGIFSKEWVAFDDIQAAFVGIHGPILSISDS